MRVGASASFLVLLLTFLGVSAPTAGSAAEKVNDRAIGLLQEAKRAEEYGEIEDALRLWTLVTEHFAGSVYEAEALLQLSRAQIGRGAFEAGRAAARAVIDRHPRDLRAVGARVQLGEAAFRQAHGPQGLEDAFHEFSDASRLERDLFGPAPDWRTIGAVRAAETAILLGRESESSLLLLDVVDLERASCWSARARVDLGELLLRRQDWVAAGGFLQEGLETALRDGTCAETASAAMSRLGLLDRLWLRPQRGEPRWPSAGVLPPEASDWKRPVAVAASSQRHLAVLDDAGPIAVLSGKSLEKRVVAKTLKPQRIRLLREADVVVVGRRSLVLPWRHEAIEFMDPGASAPGQALEILDAAQSAFQGWWVLVEDQKRLIEFDRDQGVLRTIELDRGVDPVGIEVDELGRVHVLDAKNRRILRYSIDGEALPSIGSATWKRPVRFAMDASGHYYVLDRGTRSIEVLDPSGRPIESLRDPLPGGLSLERPIDLAVDDVGRILLVDAGSDVVLRLD